MAQHASTAARIALRHRVRASAIHHTHDMLGAYRELAGVVHKPIEGLRDHRAQEPNLRGLSRPHTRGSRIRKYPSMPHRPQTSW